jgi:DNA primase small subunit
LRFLTDDFGFSAEEIKVFFSGHRGYHVHLENEAVRSLEAPARKEIVDYVAGIGLDESFYGVKETGKALSNPNFSNSGWSERVMQEVYEVLAYSSPLELEGLGLKKRAVEAVVEHRDVTIKSPRMKEPWNIVKGIGTESWKRVIHRGIEVQAAKIDTVVTTDIHRLIRLSNTLHGKTGLKKTEVSTKGLDDFDPLKKAVAFEKGTTEVLVHDSPEFRIGDIAYAALAEQRVELPMAAAMFLLCKGVAEVSA